MKVYLKLSLVLSLSLFAFGLLYSECIDETTTTVYGKTCSSTICDTYYDGNCIDFHCDYDNYSDDTVDCRDSCDLKECKSWDIDRTDTGEDTVSELCCKFDISNASCQDTCPRLTKGTKTVHKKCEKAVCN